MLRILPCFLDEKMLPHQRNTFLHIHEHSGDVCGQKNPEKIDFICVKLWYWWSPVPPEPFMPRTVHVVGCG